MLYAGWTLVSAAFSPERATSFTDCKQLVLLLLVPLTYDIVDEASAVMLTTIILAAAAVSAVIGIGQYSILHYDNLGHAPAQHARPVHDVLGADDARAQRWRSRACCS